MARTRPPDPTPTKKVVEPPSSDEPRDESPPPPKPPFMTSVRDEAYNWLRIFNETIEFLLAEGNDGETKLTNLLHTINVPITTQHICSKPLDYVEPHPFYSQYSTPCRQPPRHNAAEKSASMPTSIPDDQPIQHQIGSFSASLTTSATTPHNENNTNVSAISIGTDERQVLSGSRSEGKKRPHSGTDWSERLQPRKKSKEIADKSANKTDQETSPSAPEATGAAPKEYYDLVPVRPKRVTSSFHLLFGTEDPTKKRLKQHGQVVSVRLPKELAIEKSTTFRRFFYTPPENASEPVFVPKANRTPEYFISDDTIYLDRLLHSQYAKSLPSYHRIEDLFTNNKPVLRRALSHWGLWILQRKIQVEVGGPVTLKDLVHLVDFLGGPQDLKGMSTTYLDVQDSIARGITTAAAIL